TRMTADPASNSILSDAAAQAPTFFSMYLGHDDVMNYAMSGGLGDVITPSAGAPGSGFDGSVDAILATITANGSKGVVANLPHLNTIPYFTTVPFNGLLLDQANAAALTAAYTPLGMTFQAGYNGFVIEDAGAPGGMRKIQQGEMVLLSVPQDSLKCAGWGSMKPIPDQYILTATEITNVTNAITAYNTKLQSAAAAMNLAFVDVNAFLNTLNSGIMYNGAGISTQFVQGGTYSLDGIHLSPKGHAFLANQFIKAINAKYGSTIPAIDATRFRGVVFP
ncbi:MAG: SGNH/GDSL hydrolase family protein, partial [Flavitalea sp.]